MKKKSLLVLMLAMASTAALGLAACGEEHEEHAYTLVKSDVNFHWKECECGGKSEYAIHADANHDGKCDLEGCGQDVHVHEFTTKSDADKHWQECVYGETANVGRHIDEDKDGKCDVCDTEFVSEDGVAKVIFVMSGNGEAPATQKIEVGEKATAPEDPVAQGYIFGGWYADDRCETEFDFDAAITEDVLVYAKWTEDTTPGQSAKYAAELELEGEQLAPFGAFNKLYFKYTADEAGRYELRLQQGAASQRCSFTTDLGEDSFYEAATYYFDLAEGQEVVVTVTRGEDVTDTQGVGVYIAKTVTEPLAESWASGTYTNGSYFVTIGDDRTSVEFRESGSDGVAVSFNYIGGEKNELSFSINGASYVMKPLDDDFYSFAKNGRVVGALAYVQNEENRVPVSAFEGVYTPADEALNEIDEIGVYADGNGYYRQAGLPKNEQILGRGGCVYLSEINMLVYSNFSMTLNYGEDGEVESVTVTYTGAGVVAKCVYNKTGGVPADVPARLPIEEGKNYYGHTRDDYYIVQTGELQLQYWKDTGYRVIVDSYDSETDTYTIEAKDTLYQVKIRDCGADPDNAERTLYELDLYDATGETLLDTLAEYRPLLALKELPDATEPATVNLTLEDFRRGEAYYEVKTAGWYRISYVYDLPGFSINANIKKEREGAGTGLLLTETHAGSDVVYLYAETLVRVTMSRRNGDDGSRTFTVQNVGEAYAPAGYLSNKPIEISDVGLTETRFEADRDCFYTLSLPVGKYLVSVYSGNNWKVKYELNGAAYDYTEDAAGSNPVYTELEVTDADTPIALKVRSAETFVLATNIKIRIEEDCRQAPALSVANNGEGQFTQSGAYRYDDLLKDFPVSNGLTIGSDEEDAQEFTIVVNGETQTVKRITLSAAQLEKGFRINLADGQEVGYCVNFLIGAQQKPFEAEGAGRLDFEFLRSEDVAKWISYTAPTGEDCVVSLPDSVSRYVYFEINGVKYGYDKDGNEQAGGLTYEVAAGATITIKLGVDDETNTHGSSFSLFVAYNFKNAQELQMQGGVPTEDHARANYAVVSIAANQSLCYTIVDTAGSDVQVSSYAPFTLVSADTTVYEVTGANGIYTATIPAGRDLCFRLTSETAQNISFVIPYPLGSFGNPYTVSVEEGVYTSVSIPAETVAYFSFTAGAYTADRDLYRTNGTKLAANVVFDVTEGEVLRTTLDRIARVVTIEPRVSLDFVGKYAANDKTVEVTQREFKVDGKTYAIDKIVNGVYTFVKGNDSTDYIEVSFQVNANNEAVLVFGGTEYDYVYMFTEEMAQTYTGSGKGNYGMSDFTYSLTLNRKGQGVFSVNGPYLSINESVLITEENGTYAFSYMRGNNKEKATFTFGTGGVISISNNGGYLDPTTLNPTTPFEYDPTANTPRLAVFPAGAIQTFSGTGSFYGSSVSITLALNEDGTGAYTRLGGGYTGKIMMLKGVYSFTDNGYVISFTFGENGVISLNDSRYGASALTLTPATAFNPTLFNMLTADQAGTYTGKGTVWFASNTDVTLILNRDGSGRLQFKVKSMGLDRDDAIQLVEAGNGAYTFTYFDGKQTVNVTFNADGTLTLNGGNFSNVKLALPPRAIFTAEQAGTYSGSTTKNFMGTPMPVEIILTFNEFGKGTFSYNFNNNGAEEYNIEISKAGATYSFVWDSGYETESFTINADGTLSVTSTKVNPYTLSLGGGAQYNTVTAGNYKGVDENDVVYWIIVNSDLETIKFIIADPLDPVNEDCALAVENGTYSFTYLGFMSDTFTVDDDGNIVLQDMSTITLEKTTEEPPVSAGLEENTYTGTIDVEGVEHTVTLVTHADGTVDYSYSHDEEEPAVFNGLAASGSDGNYSFTYTDSGFDTSVSFTVSDASRWRTNTSVV